MTDQLIAAFAEGLNVPADVLSDESSTDNTPQWDSLAAMNLVALLEDTFDVRLSTREIMKMHTIGIAIAVLLAWSILASTTDVPFVYQGF
jgi:acyl carrier protein